MSLVTTYGRVGGNLGASDFNFLRRLATVGISNVGQQYLDFILPLLLGEEFD